MKKIFFAHFKKSEREFKELWDSAIFAVDTNVLLNLYRYSDKTRDTVLTVLESQKEKLFLPYQVGKEFFYNLADEIGKRTIVYNEIVDAIEKLEKKLQQCQEKSSDLQKRHPFIPKEILDDFFPHSEKLKENIKKTKAALPDAEQDHILLERIASLFQGKVGIPFDDEAILKLKLEAQKRFDEQKPPGYKDNGKGGDRKYGDFFIWEQVIARANEEGKPVIFITDDNKEDWWLIRSGKTISPRTELLEEFKRRTSQNFWMYGIQSFLKFESELRKTELPADVIDETEQISFQSNNTFSYDIDKALELVKNFDVVGDREVFKRFQEACDPFRLVKNSKEFLNINKDTDIRNQIKQINDSHHAQILKTIQNAQCISKSDESLKNLFKEMKFFDKKF